MTYKSQAGLKISLQIADRIYKINVSSEQEEERFRKACADINKMLKDYATFFAYKDKQDLLAMVALHFASIQVENKQLQAIGDEQVINSLKEIENILSKSLT